MFSTELLMMNAPTRWYAVYTSPRHEKSVLQHLQSRSVESFLPLYSSARLWNGRRATVQLPLFPGYLFVRIHQEERLRVLEAPGVLNIISSHGKLVPLPEGEIEAMRTTLEARGSEPYPYLTTGKKVRIKTGLLSGLEGVIVRQTSRLRLVVSIQCIMRSFVVELEASDLEIQPASVVCQAA